MALVSKTFDTSLYVRPPVIAVSSTFDTSLSIAEEAPEAYAVSVEIIQTKPTFDVQITTHKGD
jgi:hypothetical protein